MRNLTFVVSFLVVLLAPTFNGSLALAQEEEPVQPLIEIGVPGSLHSDILDEERAYWVHLPESYSDSKEEAYPVIYLLDGEQHLGGLAALQHYYNHFRLPEMIVVAISNAENRTRDLTPTVVEARNGAPVESSGGAAVFRSFLADELIPHIEATYATSPHRVLIGHSFGGLFVVDTLVRQGDLFTNYIALDPSLDWEDGQWLDRVLEDLPEMDFEGRGLYLAIANEIIRFSDTLTFETVGSDTSPFSLGVRSLKRFADVQSGLSNGLSFSWKFYEKDIHGSVPMTGMRDALVHMYDFWELKRPSVYNDPDSPTDIILSLINEQSAAREKGMGYPLPMEHDLLEMLGHFYSDVGQTEKAKGVLLLASGYYPQSLTLHVSLVDVCMNLQDESCAREHARQADDLTGTSEQWDRVTAALEDK